MAFLLQVADLNSQAIEATLDGTLFYIVLNWNETGQYWTLQVRNSAYETVVQGISVSANYPLTKQFRYGDMPAGELIVENANWRSGPVPRDGFSSGRYQLTYFTQQDLLLMGVLPTLGYTSDAV